jgi:hypothetical protein
VYDGPLCRPARVRKIQAANEIALPTMSVQFVGCASFPEILFYQLIIFARWMQVAFSWFVYDELEIRTSETLNGHIIQFGFAHILPIFLGSTNYFI